MVPEIVEYVSYHTLCFTEIKTRETDSVSTLYQITHTLLIKQIKKISNLADLQLVLEGRKDILYLTMLPTHFI